MTFAENILGARSRCIIGEVRCDASTSETHEKTGNLTEHPVEFGADVADHYRVGSPLLSVEGEVTNTPLGVGYPLETAINSAVSAFTGGNPVDNAWRELNRYFDEKVVITIETSLDTYYDMVLTSLTVNRSSESGGRLQFSVTAKRVVYAYTSEIDALVSIAADTASETVQEASSEGAQTTADATSQQSAAAEEILQSLSEVGIL